MWTIPCLFNKESLLRCEWGDPIGLVKTGTKGQSKERNPEHAPPQKGVGQQGMAGDLLITEKRLQYVLVVGWSQMMMMILGGERKLYTVLSYEMHISKGTKGLATPQSLIWYVLRRTDLVTNRKCQNSIDRCKTPWEVDWWAKFGCKESWGLVRANRLSSNLQQHVHDKAFRYNNHMGTTWMNRIQSNVPEHSLDNIPHPCLILHHDHEIHGP